MSAPDWTSRVPLAAFVRYGYSGFLMLVAVTLIDAPSVKTWIEAAGPVASPLAVFFLGACIYIVYRNVLGEFILYPLMHFVHFLLDLVQFRGTTWSSPTALLRAQGIRFGMRRAAYTELRRRYFDAEMRSALDFAHSEIHIVYLTAVVLALTGAYTLWIAPSRPGSIAFFVAAVIVYVAGIVTDIQQHRVEWRLLRADNQQDWREFLRARGYDLASTLPE